MFAEEPAATIWNGKFAVVTNVSSPLVFQLLFSVVSPAKTIVFPIFGGVLHVHCPAAFIILDQRLSVVGCPTVAGLLGSSHLVSGGKAKTIQFHKRSLAGFGIAFPTVYGPKHIAIPSPIVSVGTI